MKDPYTFILLSYLVFLIAAIYIILPMIKGFIVGAPFVPTPQYIAKKMAKIAKLKNTDNVLDPGCGDGRLIKACLDEGANKAKGYELFLVAYWLSKFNLRKYKDRAEVFFKDSRKDSLSDIDVVVCYLMPDTIKKWKEKFLEMKQGSRIVSYAFKIDGWNPVRVEERIPKYNYAPIYVYEIGNT